MSRRAPREKVRLDVRILFDDHHMLAPMGDEVAHCGSQFRQFLGRGGNAGARGQFVGTQRGATSIDPVAGRPGRLRYRPVDVS